MNSNFKRKVIDVSPYLLMILVAILVLEPQIHSRAFVSGFDYYFHMSRTYETAMQIKTGHFSYFLSLFSWHHNARIVNALYGPAGGYVSGLILLVTKSWYHWELCMSFLALFISGITMYKLGEYWDLKRSINVLISISYMLSSPVNDFISTQSFAGFAASLVPLVALLASEILTKKDVSPVKLALVLVLIIELHLMTFVLSMVLLIPCILLSFITSKFNPKLIKHVFAGAALTIILSFNAWGSIIEVFGSNLHHILPTYPGTHLGDRSYSAILNTYPKTSLLRSPSFIGLGGVILITIAVVLWLINIKRLSYVVNILMPFGLVFVWMASRWFPWKLFQKHFTVVCNLIQFPKRFLPMGLTLIYLVTGLIMSKASRPYKHGFNVMMPIFLIILSLFAIDCGWLNRSDLQSKVNNYNRVKVIDWLSMHRTAPRNPDKLRASLRSDDPVQFLNMVSNSVPDYVPTSVNYQHTSQYDEIRPYSRYAKVYFHPYYYHRPFAWSVLGQGQEVVTLRSNRNQVQTEPFAKYAHTQVILNRHPMNPKIDQIGAMRLPMHVGQNRLLIRYQPSRWFEAGMLISVITWLSTLVYLIYVRFGWYIPMP